jgi:hypothetical protein
MPHTPHPYIAYQQDMPSSSGSFLPNTVLRLAPCTRRCRCSLFETHFLQQRMSWRGISCSSGCPPATTVRADNSDTSRCPSPRKSRSTIQGSSSSRPCVRGDCCTFPGHRSGTCASLSRAHTRSCSNRTLANHSQQQKARSPGTVGTPTPTPRKTC